jgi:hypothetical protein
MITIADSVVRVLMDRATAGDDPLEIGHDPVDRAGRARGLVEEALDGMDIATAMRVGALMTRELSDRRRTIGNPQGLIPIDPLCAHVMAHLGIDPLTASWLSVMVGTVDLDDEDGVLVARTDNLPPAEESGRGSASVGDGGFWLQHGRLDIHGLPDTVAALCEGRPLREVVSHPVLDTRPLVITAIEQWDGVTTLVTDHRARPATIDELIAIAPFGCR